MSDNEAKTKLITAMGALYANTEVSGATIKAYVRMFRDVSVEVLAPAIDQACNDLKFLPTVAEIRERIHALTSPVALYPESGDAWGVVVKEIQHTGFYGAPRFDNPLITRTVENMGWRELCTSENQVADRAHFMRMYDQLRGRAESDAKLLPAARELQQKRLEAVNPAALLINNLTSGMEM